MKLTITICNRPITACKVIHVSVTNDTNLHQAERQTKKHRMCVSSSAFRLGEGLCHCVCTIMAYREIQDGPKVVVMVR